MDNRSIVKILDSVTTLMDIHDESPQKVKSYANAIFNLERFGQPLVGKTKEELMKINGVGKGIATAIEEIVTKGSLAYHEELLQNTPEGILELLSVRGIGASKIKTAWKEQGIDTVEKMLEACENRSIEKLKGFGSKSVQNILHSILFYLDNKNKLLLSGAWEVYEKYRGRLQEMLPESKISVTGSLRRSFEVIERVSLLVEKNDDVPVETMAVGLQDYTPDIQQSGPFALRGKDTSGVLVEILFCNGEDFEEKLFLTTGSPAHFNALEQQGIQVKDLFNGHHFLNEEEIYQSRELAYITPELREGTFEVAMAREKQLPGLLTDHDLKGVLHTHSTYSDGRNTLLEMAEACRDMGYQYLGIADHSKSAFFYANGLFEQRVREQHEEIEALNKKLAPFKIFKGIESDILIDGNLDYDDEILGTFDFIVASVHSVLNMDKAKATTRLLRAIDNPYTTIVGHLTGRILLQREGFPLDHKQIIDRCALNNVVIEINAHPSRLDLDWRWVQYAIEKGVMLSINPDAHSTEGFSDMAYGVAIGRKGGLTAGQTLNAMSMADIEDFFRKRKNKG
ncbi:MAG: PHP domain-containing protein [Cyclobacteriaceae bacterium]|nr:PHP domain-containing protein [Cyclobacteriaceae bacterium]